MLRRTDSARRSIARWLMYEQVAPSWAIYQTMPTFHLRIKLLWANSKQRCVTHPLRGRHRNQPTVFVTENTVPGMRQSRIYYHPLFRYFKFIWDISSTSQCTKQSARFLWRLECLLRSHTHTTQTHASMQTHTLSFSQTDKVSATPPSLPLSHAVTLCSGCSIISCPGAPFGPRGPTHTAVHCSCYFSA